MARAHGSRAQMALGFESVYGTPPPAGDFWRMPFAPPVTLGSEQPLLESELLGFGRDRIAPVKDAITVDGSVTVPLDLRYLGVWLKGLLGEPVTTGVAAASGQIVFSAQPAPNSTIQLGRTTLTTFTFVSTAPTGNQIQIGANLGATLTNAVTALNASVVAQVAEATYSTVGGNTLNIAYDAVGALGNTFQMIATANSNGSPSGPRLTGGRSRHEFRTGSWDLPSLAAEIGMPEVPYFAMVSGIKVNQMSFQMQRSGLVTATMELIAQKEQVFTSSQAGVLTEMETTRFGSFNGEIRRNGALLGNVVSGQLTYNNNLDRIETIRDDGAIDGVDPGLATLSGSIDVRFADTALFDQAVAGTACELEFVYELAANTSFSVTSHEVFLPKSRVGINGPAGVQTSFPWQAARDPVLGRSATFALVNDLPNYNNP